MANRKLVFLVAFLGLLIVGLLLAIILIPAPDRSADPGASADWVTYRSEKYGFEVQHPADWIVAVSDESEPKINIYKGGEREFGSVEARPPFIHHHNVTQVSFFPKGVGTEGVEGETATSAVKFAEPTSQSMDFLLAGGVRWATYATLAEPPASWEPFGFIWASVQVRNFSTECVLDDEVLPLERCDLGVDRPEGARIVLRGDVIPGDRAIEERMLGTFRKIVPDVAE